MTALGCWRRIIIARIALNDNNTRSHLTPPAVDPAHPHCTIIRNNIMTDKEGHAEESAVAKPVVDATDTT